MNCLVCFRVLNRNAQGCPPLCLVCFAIVVISFPAKSIFMLLSVFLFGELAGLLR
jgi:hypothetical protein